jgi:hypothetical protein
MITLAAAPTYTTGLGQTLAAVLVIVIAVALGARAG